MDVIEAIAGRRSIRKFQQRAVPEESIQKLLEAVRFYPSPANLQPLKFQIISERETRRRFESQLHWAAYLPDFTPTADELPPTYLVIIGDHSISHDFSFCAGAAAELLMLAAYDMGLGSCCLGFTKADVVTQILGLKSDCYEPLYAIAFGYPKQHSTTVEQNSDCRYWLDKNGDFVVPKRTAQEITRRGRFLL